MLCKCCVFFFSPELYSMADTVDNSNTVMITLHPSNHSDLYKYARDVNSDIYSIYVRSTCGRQLGQYIIYLCDKNVVCGAD